MSETEKHGAPEYNNELAQKIAEARTEFEGRYVLNERNMEKFGKVYDCFCSVADENSGGIKEVSFDPESGRAKVSIEVPSLELREGGMTRFVDVLQFIDALDATSTASDSVLIEASVDCVWEVAG